MAMKRLISEKNAELKIYRMAALKVGMLNAGSEKTKLIQIANKMKARINSRSGAV